LTGSLQLLRRALGDGNQAGMRYLELALSQAHLLGDLVNDLADVIRVQAGQLSMVHTPLELAHLVEETVDLAGPLTQDHTINLERPDAELRITGDARRLRQVVLNLLSNAVQHGGSDTDVDVRVRRDGDQAVVEVIDHGPGIAEEDRERVFERFFQATHDTGRGLGVGLYLAHAIVAGHQGTIEVQPTQPHGTTFVVRLPLSG
jgi:signal transduction histidine kinase